MAYSQILIKTEVRPCMVKFKNKEKKALFHRWEDKAYPIGESALIGGHTAGQMWGVYGIVEMEDGKIEEVYPSSIRFLDKQVDQYSYEEKDGTDKNEKTLDNIIIKRNDGVTGVCIFTKTGNDNIKPINTNYLIWRKYLDCGEYLTLKEIREQVRVIPGYQDEVLFVWEEEALSGKIYQTGNQPECDKWEEHGKTRGYA